MSLDQFFVADLIIPTYYMDDIEKLAIIKSRILKKVVNGYMDVQTRVVYTDIDKKGVSRIDNGSIVSLSEYYNFLGFKKKNNYDNKEVVYQNVKHLKSQRKI